jgi:DNA-binding MarR family transcriptional regulator
MVTPPYGGGVARGDPTEEIIELLFALVDRLRAGFEAVAAAHELSAPQAKALRHVVAAGPVPMRDLACRLRCDASNVTGIVDRLEQRGLVERRSAPGDRRIKSLVATPTGTEVACTVWSEVEAGAATLLSLDEDERKQLLAILLRLSAATVPAT